MAAACALLLAGCLLLRPVTPAAALTLEHVAVPANVPAGYLVKDFGARRGAPSPPSSDNVHLSRSHAYDVDFGYGGIGRNTAERLMDRLRVTRSSRPVKNFELLEKDGSEEGALVLQLERQHETETFEMHHENPWVTVDSSGEVHVKKKWDYEELGPEKSIDFWVTIKNVGEEISPEDDHDNQRIIIRVQDDNDENPYLINRPLPMQAVVKLNAPPNTPVFVLSARDPDTDADIHYFMVRDRTGGRFQVDERSGVVRTRGSEPFQLDMEYVLYVKAEDQNGRDENGNFQATKEERLSIVGGNRPPQFYLPQYDIEIFENSTRDSPVGAVKARSFADREIRYTLKAQGQGAGTFNIGPTSGIVKLAKELDFEDVRQPHIYSLVVTATEDSGGFSTSVELTIKVMDVNDNVPKFEMFDYQTHNVPEDVPVGSELLRVKGTDADSGTNADLFYSVSDDHFRVDDKGVIYNNRVLDADNNNGLYQFLVTATDRGEPAKTGTATVRVYTKNKNDEEPRFTQQVYTPNVDENAGPNALVTTVVASDKDGDRVKYGFANGGNTYGQFMIEPYTGVIRLRNSSIDLHEDKYELNVTATDDGSCCDGGSRTIHTSTAVVVVFITDVNDNKPIFKERCPDTARVVENSPVGTYVTEVRAPDDDKGVNGQVKYSTVQHPSLEENMFTVDEDTGKVYTNKVFDREGSNGEFVPVLVKARDGGTPPLETFCVFLAEIVDENDNWPYFDEPLYEATVDENEDINHVVLSVTANDIDASSRIRYELTRGNIGGAFGVKNSTGAIFVAGPLDYETRNRYELRLVASDNRNENYTDVVIHVRDVNDNPPEFDKLVYQPQITEEDDRGLPKLILQVKTSDRDVTQPADIVYFLSGQGIDGANPSNSTFTVNRTSGEIFVTKPLDRDMPNGRPHWRFTVFAQDEGGKGLVGYAEVQVNLKDINDNAPVFPNRVYRGNVTEGGPKDMFVMVMRAEDIDDPEEGSNAKLIYSIEKNVVDEAYGKPIFAIEPNTGVIRTNICCLDREKIPDYSIQVVAMDGGGLKGTATASIDVRDINDMPPRFSKPIWNTTVDETDGSDLPDKAILTVTVLDEDVTNKFHYRVLEKSSYGADKFTMVRNRDGTGSLKIVQPLDYEDDNDRNGFTFQIQVNDGAGDWADPNHVAYATVHVKLRDINDNTPVFDKSYIEVNVLEDAEVGSELTTFHASDPDQGGRSKVSYAIDRDSDRKRQFVINDAGTVSIQRGLDREEVPRHHIKILAIDDGVPPKTATATLTVIVNDVNDNAPTFLEDYRPVVMENWAPRLVASISAFDPDDRSKGNGPPFTFRLDPAADDVIRYVFRVEHDPVGTRGEGLAVVKSLVTFDRESRKEYHVPIVIKDSGQPPQSGTSTLTVVIGDENDHKMAAAEKQVLVYRYKGMVQEVQVGRVFVDDKDAWDLPDKTFSWVEPGHSSFYLHENTGTITMEEGTEEGRYFLRFRVTDRKHAQTDVEANVTVVVQNLPEEAVLNSGSLRIAGISDEDFIRIWDSRQKTVKKSKLEKFREVVAGLVGTAVENVDVFSVQLKQERPPVIDVRYSARNSSYLRPVMLDGTLLINRRKVEEEVGINITMVNIDECLEENVHCTGTCSSRLVISEVPHLVDANRTAVVGVRMKVVPECTCQARNFSREETCGPTVCLNGGKCIQQREGGVKCMCRPGYDGPRCQQTSRSFRGDGWAWLPPLSLCERTHLSVEFTTRRKDGLILYNGPITAPEADQPVVSDFIALELEEGNPRLLLDFGSGTLQLTVSTEAGLDDGEWHRLDMFWDREHVRLLVDLCLAAQVVEPEDGAEPVFQDSTCAASGVIPPFNEYLNVNAPLQLGGVAHAPFGHQAYGWQHRPTAKPFDGCIRNLVVNSELYDLSNPGLNRHSYPGCPQVEAICSGADLTSRCGEHGRCVGSMTRPKCECDPGWSGPGCNISSVPVTFKPNSYVKYALAFWPGDFSNELQLRFRTREDRGQLLGLSDYENRRWLILDISDARLRLRYNLNILRTEEHELTLSSVKVNDGQWHVVRVTRHGSAAILRMDGGEGRRYNETIEFVGPQLLDIDQMEGVYVGGRAEYTGVRTYTVHSDFRNGCLDDIRLQGRLLPLPPAVNGTQWGQATMFRNVQRGCDSGKPCDGVICPYPYSCADMWRQYECV